MRLLSLFSAAVATASALLAGRRLSHTRCAPRRAAGPASEFSRTVDVVATKARTLAPATPDELAGIAARVGVDAVASLQAAVSCDRAELVVALNASVRQTCVSTGAPVVGEIAAEEAFLLAAAGEDGFADDDDDDDVVLLPADGRVDVGELALQVLSLNVDPYPSTIKRTADAAKPVASFRPDDDDDDDDVLSLFS